MSQVETIRIEIEQKKEMIAIGEAISRIVRTRDWKKLIESEYLEKEPQRLVSLLAHPGMQDEASQKEIHNQMVAIAYFRQFIATQLHMAELAKQALPEDQETEAHLLATEIQE